MRSFRRIGLLVLMMIVSTGLFAQDVSLLGSDLETVIRGLRDAIVPGVQLAGTQALQGGAVSDTAFTAGAGLGVVLAPDAIGFLLSDSAEDYDLIVPAALIGPQLGIEDGSDDGDDIDAETDAFLDRFGINPLALPVLRGHAGFRLPGRVQVLVSGFLWPAGLTNAITAIPAVAGVAEGAVFGLSNITGRATLPLTPAERPWAFSLGAAYARTAFTFAFPLPETVELAGFGTLTFTDSSLELAATVNSFGAEFRMARKRGALRPFAAFTPVYQVGSFTGGANDTFDLSITLEGGSNIAFADEDEPIVESSINDFTVIFATGLDVRFGRFGLNLTGSIDPQSAYPGFNLSTIFAL